MLTVMDAVVLTLARLARLLERACTELTLSQYRLLAMIADGAERASQIAGRLAVTKPTVSATIDTLVERGLVSRAIADDDRRALRLQITAEGRAVLGAAERGMREQLDALLIHVDDPQAVRLALGRLGDALDQRREQRRVAREQA
jgi:DNA-binding MarR family transcriptional regulator